LAFRQGTASAVPQRVSKRAALAAEGNGYTEAPSAQDRDLRQGAVDSSGHGFSRAVTRVVEAALAAEGNGYTEAPSAQDREIFAKARSTRQGTASAVP